MSRVDGQRGSGSADEGQEGSAVQQAADPPEEQHTQEREGGAAKPQTLKVRPNHMKTPAHRDILLSVRHDLHSSVLGTLIRSDL